MLVDAIDSTKPEAECTRLARVQRVPTSFGPDELPDAWTVEVCGAVRRGIRLYVPGI